MKYVLDANIAAKWMLPENDSDKAIAVRDEFKQQLHELIAPDVFPVEVGHTFTRAERQGRITQSESLNFWADVMTTPPQLISYLPLMPDAMAMSSLERIGVYDCLYVILAIREKCWLLTADEKLIKNLPGYPIIPLSSL